MPFLSTPKSGAQLLAVLVQPRASRNKITGIHDGAIKIATTAPPVDGRANDQIVAFLAKLLKIPKSAITVKNGLKSRRKRLEISGYSAERIRPILEQAAGSAD